MKLAPEQLNKLFTLFGTLREETITPQEFAELNQFLKTYPEAQDFYLDYVYLCSDLCNLQAAIKHAPIPLGRAETCAGDEEADLIHPPLTLDILKVLGDYENKAEALELPSPKDREEIACPDTSVKRNAPAVSKLSIFSLITSLAALLFIIAYPHVFPQPPVGVASISDAIGAKWSRPEPLEIGTRLLPGTDPIQIIQGFVKIQTDNGAHLVLEAPAEFRFTNSDELSMNYGRIFVNVKKASNGFIVQTNKSKIIDLGTQFGVYTDIAQAQTELHVFEGKTVLIAGLHKNDEQSVDVSAGQARKFGKSFADVQPILLSERFFVRDIESKANRIWRSEKCINLADVVGGGDGLGTGTINTGINPSNRPDDEIGEMRDRRSPNQYNPVPASIYIDGVFVPNGSAEQIVTSAGHVFRDCPATSGYFFADILNTPTEILAVDQAQPLSILLEDIRSSKGEDSFLCIHANSGITFDLRMFRSRLHEGRILRFRSTLKILDVVPEKNNIKSAADFWILLDGQVRYGNTLSRGMADPVDIEIAETDRFLTLITTDGGYRDKELDRNAIGYDWCIFDQPKLILE